MNRELPAATDAESYLLSCCLIEDSDTLARAIAAGVTCETFHDTRHATIFGALCRMYEARMPVAVHVLAQQLKDAGEMERVGGYAFLTQITDLVATTAQASYFIEKVIEKAILRQLIRRSAAVTENAYNWAGEDIHALVEQASSSLMGAAPAQSHATNWQEDLAAVQRGVDIMADPKADPHAGEVSFGFADLDRLFQPMRGGQLVILAARPSVGKSSLARMIAHDNARRGHPVIFASLEVMGQSLAISLAQTITGIPYRSLRKAHAKDVASFRAAVGSLALPSLHVLAASSVRIAALRARAKLLRARGTPARLIVVDYLGILPDAEPMSRGENRTTSVGRCSRALKQLAIAEDCPVLALAQLNRESAKDGREPALHDLRESGDIEQDADKVIFLHRPAENPITRMPQPETSLPSEVPSFYVNAIQAKGRDDGTAIVSLNFRRAVTRFEQIARMS